MKASRIQYSCGGNVEGKELERVCKTIVEKAACVGFITDATILNETAIKIGLHMRSFRIDVSMLGHNARMNGRFGKSPKGYKRCDVPTWDQRVEFNNLVNSVFDRAGLVANIVSGNYTVRRVKSGAETSWPEGGDRSFRVGFSGDASPDIVRERDARQYADSDALEKDHKETLRARARVTNAELREIKKKLKAADFVSFFTYDYDSRSNVRQIMTFTEFLEWNTQKKNRHQKISIRKLTPIYGGIDEVNLILVKDRLTKGKS